MATVSSFIERVHTSIMTDGFIKLSLGNYQGLVVELKNIYVKAVVIKRELKLSFTYRYKTRDITKNHTVDEGLKELHDLLDKENFRVSTLFTAAENLVFECNKKGVWSIKSSAASSKKPTTLSHDKQKERKLGNSDKKYLQDLRLTDVDGKVYKNAQDKWKQINHYIDILSSMLASLPTNKELQVVDMGAGKGYLTFALYDYLNYVLQKPAHVVGVEYRSDLVELCNGIAERSGFTGLCFEQGTIEDFQPKENLDILIALHACDTATDDAIAKGIKNKAQLIVVAPCCHKQIRKQMEAGKAKNELDFLTKHGIFMERQAEMLTDGMRALIMEYFGYQTKVFQFVSDAHTPKNILVVGVRKEVSASRKQEILAKIKSSKAYFAVEYHYLESLMGL